MKKLAMVWMLLVAACVQAEPLVVSDDVPARMAAQRQLLQSQRSAIEHAHDAMQRECWQRFAVNACLREVRRQRHAALDPLGKQELELNAQERAWRTLRRDERLRDKAEGQERQP